MGKMKDRYGKFFEILIDLTVCEWVCFQSRIIILTAIFSYLSFANLKRTHKLETQHSPEDQYANRLPKLHPVYKVIHIIVYPSLMKEGGKDINRTKQSKSYYFVWWSNKHLKLTSKLFFVYSSYIDVSLERNMCWQIDPMLRAIYRVFIFPLPRIWIKFSIKFVSQIHRTTSGRLMVSWFGLFTGYDNI